MEPQSDPSPESPDWQLELIRIGQNVSLARRTKSLTQSELARRAGIGLSTVVAVEQGRQTVTLSHWLKVLQILELDGALPSMGSFVAPSEGEETRKLVPLRVVAKARR